MWVHYGLRAGIVAALACGLAMDAPGDDLKPEVLQLAHFKQKVRHDIAQINNCTCLETMERSIKPVGALDFRFLDRIRLEVTRSGNDEMLAWPGGTRFEQSDIKAFVQSGLVAAGMFAAQPRSVFVSEQTTFHYAGTEELDGHHAEKYDFRIPALSGLFKLGTGTNSSWVGSRGTFWFDKESLALLRLDSAADDIPAALDIASSVTHLRYGPMRTASGVLLAPETAEVLMTRNSGATRRDLIRFSNCREYTADSSIRFEAPPEEQALTGSKATGAELPGGLKLDLQLDTGLEWKTAAIGDPVSAHLRKEIRWKGGVLPRGTIATGRLQGMERHPKGGFVLTIRLADLRWDDHTAPFHAQVVEVQPTTGDDPVHTKQANAGNMLGLTSGSTLSGVPEIVSSGSSAKGSRIPNLCTVWLRSENWTVAAGMGMTWRTLAP